GVQTPANGGAVLSNALSASPDGRTFYVMSRGEIKVWRDGVVKSVAPVNHGNNEAFPSPDGRYLVFSGNRGVERFDAVTGELACVSCMPDGTPSDDLETGSTPLPGSGAERTIGDRYERVVTNSGQVFYTSGARLVAADVNGKTDVYEYRDGSNHLISPGNAPYNARMGDISEDARDVYFATGQKLVGRDNDEQTDIYDARIGGELPVQNPEPPQECFRDDCKATPNAGPELPFGGSEALSGPGNVQPAKHKKCGKGKRAKKVKGKVRCVKKQTQHKAGKNKKGGNR
ncbi:MAG TPA: hypothetical protein VLC07_02560, partial [Solirubrobacterales bacterium]|nr:hypothetical protein [Solirubrobacterales bacterium]